MMSPSHILIRSKPKERPLTAQPNRLAEVKLNNTATQKTLPIYTVGFSSVKVKKTHRAKSGTYSRSMHMLHAYGEYDRFMKASQTFIKSKNDKNSDGC